MKKKGTTSPIAIAGNQIKYITLDVEIDDLKELHPIYEKLKLTESEFYSEEAKYFDYYELPVVTEDLMLLTNIESYRAAKKNGIRMLEVVMVKGIDSNDITRFINYSLYVKKMNQADRYALCLHLRDYLEKNKNGKTWAETLKGDINQKLGTILGYDHETIKLWQRVGRKTLVESKRYRPRIYDLPSPETDEEYEEEKKQINEELKRIESKKKALKLKDFSLVYENEKPQIFYKKINLQLKLRREQTTNSLVFSFKPTSGKGQIKIYVESLQEMLTTALVNEQDNIVVNDDDTLNREEIIDPEDENKYLHDNWAREHEAEAFFVKLQNRIRRKKFKERKLR